MLTVIGPSAYFQTTATSENHHLLPISETDGWMFNIARDARAYALTNSQCISAFPGLYAEIDRAVSYHKNIGLVTEEDLDITWTKSGAVKALIFDQQVRYLLASHPISGLLML